MNFGAFAGGAAKGISQGIEDKARMDDSEFKKRERDRQEEERRIYDGIVKQVAEADKARRKLNEQIKPSPQQTVAMGGIKGIQQIPPAGEEFGQMVGGGNQAPVPPAAWNNFIADAGITKPTAQPGYRDHAAEDKFAMVDDMYGRLLNAGLYNKAADVGQVRTALLGEKLQNETRQRESAARGVIAALDNGDDKAIFEASKAMSKLMPDGKELYSLKSLPDGRIEAVYGKEGEEPKIVTRDQLKQSAAALVDWKVALDVSHRAQQLDFERRKNESDEKHKGETLAETKRHNIASEEIIRSKVSSGGLTASQQRTNAEIEAARKYVRGLNQEEIRRRTQQYSATGRENPDYDPMLAAKVRLSQHSKYGEDADFAEIAKPAADPMEDIGSRFTADSAMKGHRLGKQTQHGFEVLDASGKLIGYWN